MTLTIFWAIPPWGGGVGEDDREVQMGSVIN